MTRLARAFTLTLLLLPAAAVQAQAQISMDQALRGWNAAVQMGAPNGVEGYYGEVCWGCSEEISAAVARHALMVMQLHGVNTWGFDAGSLDPNPEPQLCEDWFYDEELGYWINRCWTNHTMRCYTGLQIDHMREIEVGARQAAVWYAGAAVFANSLGATRPYGLVFSAISVGFNFHALNVGRYIDRMEAARCNP